MLQLSEGEGEETTAKLIRDKADVFKAAGGSLIEFLKNADSPSQRDSKHTVYLLDSINAVLEETEQKELEKKLKGLGYLD